MRALVCLLLFGCSETGTGVLLELDGTGMVDEIDIVGSWDGATQKSGSTMGKAQSLPVTILIEMPARAVTAKFSVTAKLAGQVVGQGETLEVMVKPHQQVHVMLSLGGVQNDLSLSDLAGLDFSPLVADLSKADLALLPCSGPSRCSDGGVCNGFEGASVDPPWYTLTRTGCAATIDNTRACRGSKSIHVTLPNMSGLLEAFVFETMLTPSANTIYFRGFFYFPANLGYYTALIQAYQSFGPDFRALTLTGSSNGTFHIDNASIDPPTYSNDSAMHFPLNRWVCVEMKLVSSASGAGTVTTWIDGAQQNDIDVTNATTEPSPAYDVVSFGISENAGATTVPAEEVWIDEVLVDTQPIGCLR
jgi:hypothetical protein